MTKKRTIHSRITYVMGIMSFSKLLGMKNAPDLEGLTDYEIRNIFRRLAREWVEVGCPDER